MWRASGRTASLASRRCSRWSEGRKGGKRRAGRSFGFDFVIFLKFFQKCQPKGLTKGFKKVTIRLQESNSLFHVLWNVRRFYSSCRALRPVLENGCNGRSKCPVTKSPPSLRRGFCLSCSARSRTSGAILTLCPDCGQRPRKVCCRRILHFVRECGTLF